MSTHHPTFGRTSGIGNVFKSITKSLKTSGSSSSSHPSNVSVRINPMVVGGSTDQLLQHLRSGPLPARASAAAKMTETLESVSLSSFPEVWYAARDMCNPKIQSYIRRIAITLLIQCIKQDENSISDRLTFFKDITYFCQISGSRVDDEFDLFIRALKNLTNDGKIIHDFCVYDQGKNLSLFLLSALIALSNTQKKFNDSDSWKSDKNFRNLIELNNLIKNCFKFSFSILDESSITSLISGISELVYTTKNSIIMNSCLEVINTVVVFGAIPFKNFNQVMSLCCYTYGTLSNELLTKITWEIIHNLSIDTTFHLVLTSLCDVMTNPDLQVQTSTNGHTNGTHTLSRSISSSILSQSKRSMSSEQLVAKSSTNNATAGLIDVRNPINTCIGAIQLMEKIQIESALEDKANFSCFLTPIFKAYKTALSFNIPLINTSILRSFDRLFSIDGTNDVYSVNLTFEKLFPFHLWYSPTFSIYDVLDSLKLNSDLDISYWKSICLSLQGLFENHKLQTPKDKLVGLFFQHYNMLDSNNVNFILNFYHEERLCTSVSPFAAENCNELLNCFYYGVNSNSEISHYDASIRIETLRIIKDSYILSMKLFNSFPKIEDIIYNIFRRSLNEKDPLVIRFLVNDFLLDIGSRSSFSFFEKLLNIFFPLFQARSGNQDRLKSFISIGSIGSGSQYSRTNGALAHNETTINSERSIPDDNLFTNEDSNFRKSKIHPLMLVTVGESLVGLFVSCSNKYPRKSHLLYEAIIQMLQYSLSTDNIELSLIMMRCLVRIRATLEKYVYFIQPTDMEGLATALGRNTIASDFLNEDFKWIYPESPDYLPEEFFNKPSKKLKLADLKSINSYLNGTQYDESNDECTIEMSQWLRIVLDVMENVYHWELYTFIWAHFCSQLSNMELFAEYQELIVNLQKIICDQLSLNLPKKLSIPKASVTITKADLQVAYVRTLSGLLGYHEMFSKYEEDQIIGSLIFGLGSWDKTAIPCIHILTVCCYEIPISIKKYLTAILTKLQTRVTSLRASAHTLEFLVSLIHLPTLTSNFTTDEFKRVFAIAFKYIQYSNDLRLRTQYEPQSQPSIAHQQYGAETKVDNMVSTQLGENSPMMNQYLLQLSYSAILAWFLKIDMNERRQVSGYLVKNLILSNSDEKELDDHTIAFLDLIIRFTYSNLPVKNIIPSKISNTSLLSTENNISTNRWILGNSIIGIDTNILNGDSVLTIRRPTGVSILKLSLDPSMIPEWTKINDGNKLSKIFGGDRNKALINSNYLLLQLFNNVDKGNNSKPIPIIEDAATLRAISSLDRIPIVEFHKVGIMYIAPGQSSEVEVLGNDVGSRNYQNFIEGIGRIIKLKNCKDAYVGGLDTENNLDGEHAIFWSDEVTHLIFHTTSMMPNNPNDKYFDLKKRHIGNNYVNIYFDESGLPFNFNLIKSQFNFLNVVISPHTITSEFSLSEKPNNKEKFFKVKTYRREGVPGVFSTCHFKLILESQLAIFIRNLVLILDDFANVWHSSGQSSYVSNWSHRVKQIRLLKDKTLKNHQVLEEEQQQQQLQQLTQAASNHHHHPSSLSSAIGGDAKSNPTKDATFSFMEQLQYENTQSPPATTNLASGESTGKYEYVSNNENELYTLLEFNSYT